MTVLSNISGRFNHSAARVVKVPSFAGEIGTANSSDDIIYATRRATDAGRSHWLTFLRIPRVNRQGQAHIVSTARISPSFMTG
ncbi:MAG: hypothetical protein DME48_07110 [Verrucomicrobia bacterium]|nr:MAG: hypothetical protein DME48_07110 [Verrucomicrobiota bacterium]